MNSRYDVFLSHSSADKPAVEKLAHQLEAAGIKVFFDKWHLIPGEPWEEALEEALKESQTCAAFLGPGELRPWQNEELRVSLNRRARKQMLRVIPVLLPDSFLPREEDLPLFLSRLTWVDFRSGLDDEEAFQELVRGIKGESLKSGGGESSKPLRSISYRCMAQRPEGYVPRQEYEKVIEALLSGNKEHNSVGITTALQGAGGFGKTFLAQQICFDERVRERFPNGILWVKLKEVITPEGPLSGILEAIRLWTGEEPPAFENATNAGAHLRNLLASLRVLLVVDDVWNPADVTPFQGLESGSALLITTRNLQTLPRNSRNILVDAIAAQEAVQILRSDLPNGLDQEFESFAADLGEWPLLLGLVNRYLRDLVRTGLDISDAFMNTKKALKSQGFTAFNRDDQESRNAAVSKAILVSLERLSEEEKDLYFKLAAFPKDVNAPLTVLQRLWGIDGFAIQKICRRFFELSLLRNLDLLHETIRLHDVIRRVLVEESGKSLSEIHRQLLESFRPPSGSWWEVDHGEGYFWRYSAYHFLEAGWRDELRELLLRFPFIEAKMRATDVTVLIGDYESFSEEEELRLVQAALSLSAHVLFREQSQLVHQLWGRLADIKGEGIRGLLEGAQEEQATAWLRPRRTCLAPPGALIRTLEGHTSEILSMSVVDSRRAISASDDRTLRVWDLDSGQTLRTLDGHTGAVKSVSVVDSHRAVSASNDGTLRIWDLDSGLTLHILEGHMDRVRSVSVADGRIISASDDKTLRVWDLKNGRTLHALEGHTAQVRSVSVVDGCRAISASNDRTLRVWNLDSGQTLHILEGHTGWVLSVAVVDDHRAVSASSDGTLRVWDLNSGLTRYTLEGHTNWVNSVSVVNGGRVVSASSDGTLRVWDLDSGRTLHTLQGHAGGVRSVAVVDSHRAISASNDGTLRIWDLDRGQVLHTYEGHTREVTMVLTVDDCRAISVSDDMTLRVWNLDYREDLHVFAGHTAAVASVSVVDGGRAISSSVDATLRVWGLENGQALHILEGHTGKVFSVSMVDGHRAVSSSEDETLRVWDLDSGKPIYTLEGHTGWVNSVSVMENGCTIVSASDDGTLRVWDLDSGQALHILKGHKGRVLSVSVVDSRRVISSSADGTLWVWDLGSGKPIYTLEGHTHGVTTVLVVDGRRAISVSEDKTLRVWDLDRREALHTLEGHTGWVYSVAVVDGRRAVSASSDGTLRVWDLDSGQALHVLEGHTGKVFSVSVVDGHRAVSSSEDETLRVWDLKTGEGISVMTLDAPVWAVAYDVERRIMVAGDSRGKVHFFDLVEPE